MYDWNWLAYNDGEADFDDESTIHDDLDLEVNGLDCRYNPKALFEVLPKATEEAPLELPEAYLLDMLEIL